MARSKKITADEEQNKQFEEFVENANSQEPSAEEAKKEEFEKEQDAQNENQKESEEVAYDGEIPEKVQKLLSLFPKYEELYIDRRGGVFTKDTQPELRIGAILYKNPFYKK